MIILYGGTFNPPTIAHLHIAKYLIEKYSPNKFIFIPVGNYYKKNDIIDFYHRFNMVKIISDSLRNSYVSDYENSLIEYRGTINTLNYFKSLYQDDIYFVLGADNLLTIDKWIKVDELLKNYKFIVLQRNFIDIKEFVESNDILKKYQKNFIIEDIKEINVSSTQYRNYFCDDVVTKEVNDYIYKNKLYARGER